MKKINKELPKTEPSNKYDSIDPTSELEEQWKRVEKIQTTRYFIGGIGMFSCGLLLFLKSIIG